MAVTRGNAWDLPDRGDGLLDMTTPSTGVPDYISSMNPYDAIQVSATPQGGGATIEQAFFNAGQGGWITGPGVPSDVGATRQIIRPWSGGAGYGPNRELYVHGGGHNDSANNALLKIKFGGDPWEGIELVDVSDWDTVSPTIPGTGTVKTYSDGKPASIHTYQGCMNYQGTFYRTDGSSWHSGSSNVDFWKHTGSAWQELAGMPSFLSGQRYTAVNQAAGKAIVFERDAGLANFYNFTTESWGAQRSISPRAAAGPGEIYVDYSCAASDTELLLVANGNILYGTVDWVAETIVTQSITVAGYSGAVAPLLFYDPPRDVYWALGGNENQDWSNIYEITGESGGATKSATAHPLSQTITVDIQVGPYNRGVFMEVDRAIGIATGMNIRPWVVRLP